jgi:PilZ domain
MKLRKYGRIAVELPASLTAVSSRGQGIVVDISLAGCRVHSQLAVKKNDSIGLLIDVPGHDKPLYINQAAIRWASNEEFGIEFIQMELSERQRLHEVVAKNAGPR